MNQIHSSLAYETLAYTENMFVASRDTIEEFPMLTVLEIDHPMDMRIQR